MQTFILSDSPVNLIYYKWYQLSASGIPLKMAWYPAYQKGGFILVHSIFLLKLLKQNQRLQTIIYLCIQLSSCSIFKENAIYVWLNHALWVKITQFSRFIFLTTLYFRIWQPKISIVFSTLFFFKRTCHSSVKHNKCIQYIYVHKTFPNTQLITRRNQQSNF